MIFLDCQDSIYFAFGSNPNIYSTSPCKQELIDSVDIRIADFTNKYVFDIFLGICKTDYVGIDDEYLEGKLIHEICKQITGIRMDKLNRFGRHHIFNT